MGQPQDPVTQKYPTGPFIKLLAMATAVGVGIPALIYFYYASIKGHGSAQSSLCIQNLTDLTTAALLYAADHDEVMPGKGWSVSLNRYLAPMPDLKDKDIALVFACPVQRRIDPQTYGYALNQELAGKTKSGVEYPGQSPLIFDSSNIKLDAIDSVKTMPLPGRHDNGRTNNAGYLDGHVAPVNAKG